MSWEQIAMLCVCCVLIGFAIGDGWQRRVQAKRRQAGIDHMCGRARG